MSRPQPLDPQASSLFDDNANGGLPQSPAALARALAGSVPAPHYDELRGPADDGGALAPGWQEFFGHLGTDGFHDLSRRSADLRRQVRDNGVTYNVYADASGPQRPWSLDLFPLIVTPESWRQVRTGVLQRVRVLEQVLADVYGPQRLMDAGLLPPALVHGHPGYLREMHGAAPVGGTRLHIAAFDLARGPDGHWWVISQRTQAPSGLGYLLENRLSVARQFPQAFDAMAVQRLGGTYRALVEGLKAMSPAGADAHIALLTPGPYNETYFEHAYLARYLGLTLVEGSDLTVRDQRVYLKTLAGLKPVHALLKRLDDEFLDPLELRSDSTLGVPGLLQAIRAGNVLVANAPGSAFLESPALLGFLPALARALLDEELQLPALPTWWCGERAARDEALPRLGQSVIKPTYPGTQGHAGFASVPSHGLDQRARDEWAGRILRQSDEYTVQAHLPLSHMPTWRERGAQDRIVMAPVVLRVFAVADGPQSWRVLPGGLARIAGAHAGVTSMQRGGSSADVWVQAPGEVDATTLLQARHTPAALVQRQRMVTSRAAENLFWLGRYTERAENTVRLARLALEALGGGDQSSSPALLAWLTAMASDNAMLQPGVPSAAQARRVFERSLIDGLSQPDLAGSVAFNLGAIRTAAFAVRERLSREHWNLIVQAGAEFTRRCAAHAGEASFAPVEALRVLESVSGHLAAITGGQTDRMTRDDGWRLLSLGRHVERLAFLASALEQGLETGAVFGEAGFEAIVALFDSTITFHARYQQSRDIAPLVDLLVMDRDNPRSLAWVAQTLRGRLARLDGSARGELGMLSQRVPDPDLWDLEALCRTTGGAGTGMPVPAALRALLEGCTAAAYAVSDEISARYFTHSGEARYSTGV